MNDLRGNKNNMSSFLDTLSENRRTMEHTRDLRKTRSFRWNCIKEKQDQGKRNAAKEVFLSIYRGALPIDKNHKSLYQDSLDKRILSHVEKSGAADVYDFLADAARKGSKPAELICEKTGTYMSDHCARYYEAGDDFDPEKIDVDADSAIVSDVVQKVSSDMSIDEITSVIEDNVKATIAREIAISKEEDEKLKNLEEELTGDDTVVSEEAIDVALYQAGYRPNSIYKPTLFNGIMVGEIGKLSGENIPGDQKQKKAFFESVQELTALQTLQTLGILDINVHNVDQIATQYATAVGV